MTSLKIEERLYSSRLHLDLTGVPNVLVAPFRRIGFKNLVSQGETFIYFLRKILSLNTLNSDNSVASGKLRDIFPLIILTLYGNGELFLKEFKKKATNSDIYKLI